jgi:hypothetical protein
MASKLTLFASIDVGGSGTKIIYQFDNWDKPKFFIMSPEVEEVSTVDFKRYQDNLIWNAHPLPEQQAFLEWKEKIYVVGDFASEFAPVDRIHERKYENALYKVLAAIGLILEKNGVASKKPKSSSPKITLHLAFLLPWNEYNDHKRFFEQLQEMFTALKFRGQTWDITLSENFLCRPEGAGLLAIRTKKEGVNWFQSHQIAILMLGHRNTTLLYFDKGNRKVADSPLLGFSSFLDTLAKAIFNGLYEGRNEVYNYKSSDNTTHPNWGSLKAIQSLATAKDESLRRGEIEDIAKTISLETANYWFRLKKWLDKNLPSMPREVIIGGGAADFIEPELEWYFNCNPYLGYGSDRYKSWGQRQTKYTVPDKFRPQSFSSATLVWLETAQTTIEGTLNIHNSSQKLGFRLIDCFGMMDQLLDKTQEVKGEGGKNQKNA